MKRLNDYMMKPLKRHKRYKNREPEETVEIIQAILKENAGFGVYERCFQERNGLFHSCRIILDNGDWLRYANIGTNGKGMTLGYSRASAFGELMERLYNFSVLMRYQQFGIRQFVEKHKEQYPLFFERIMKENAILPFLFTKDEEIDDDNERLEEALEKYVCSADNARLFNLAKDKEHFYVPYFSVKENKVVKIPFDIIYNSISTNGFCAGNTSNEALIEGLSEIFERYVIRLIYFENLSLPRIPRNFFEGSEILERLEKLEKKEQYEVEIVDCSLGKGIPAVGVVIFTADKKEYQFHMGVDPSPITALERSLTELFQGRDAIKFKKFNDDFQVRLNEDINLKEIEIHKTYSSSTGDYPMAFFTEAPSYQFSGFDERLGHSDESDLRLMMELLDSLGFQLYVRDNSASGFPVYSLYVPGMSELYNVFSLRNFEKSYEQFQNEPDEWFPEMFVDFDNVDRLDVGNMDPIDKAMILIKKGKTHEAIKLLRKEPILSLNDMNHDFAYYLENGYGLESWMYKSWLEKLSKNKYFRTSCFHCEKCHWKHNCKFFEYLSMVKKLKEITQSNNSDQNLLQTIFK